VIEPIIIILLTAALTLSMYKNFKMGMIILKMEDTIEDCLDVIDEKYEKMTEILGRPLFYDSSEVKQVVQDIKSVKESLHSVALSLTQNIEEDQSEE
tara:strand:- start:262 stop:552 length:291 start_codon:yes stop_codon:yes gene_type:complete